VPEWLQLVMSFFGRETGRDGRLYGIALNGLTYVVTFCYHDSDHVVTDKKQEEIMPTKVFENLVEEKKNIIIDTALQEFGNMGVLNASTNNIVKKCGISKGSLFKYFTSKDDLCFYLFDTVSKEMMENLALHIASFSTEVFQRIVDYSAWEIGWYIHNPVKGRFMLAVAKEEDRDFAAKREARYGKQSKNMYYELFEAVDAGSLKTDQRMAADLIKWIMEGYNKDFLEREDVDSQSFEKLKDEYINGITKCLETLKNGIIKEKSYD